MRLARALEAIPSHTALEVVWREYLGDEFDALGPLLMPHIDRADSIPIPDRATLGKVVRYPSGEFKVIDPITREACPVEPHQTVMWQLDVRQLCRAAASALELQGAPTPGPMGAWFLGTWQPVVGSCYPVYCALTASGEEAAATLMAIQALNPVRAVFLTPTHRAHCVELENAVRASSSDHTTLDTLLEIRPQGVVAAVESLDRVLPRMVPARTKKRRVERLGVVVPPGTAWSEVTFSFVDFHELRLSVRKGVFEVTPERLGLMNLKSGTPTEGWNALATLVERGGSFPLPAGLPGTALQRQMQFASEALENSLAIPGKAISTRRRVVRAAFRVGERP